MPVVKEVITKPLKYLDRLYYTKPTPKGFSLFQGKAPVHCQMFQDKELLDGLNSRGATRDKSFVIDQEQPVTGEYVAVYHLTEFYYKPQTLDQTQVYE